MKLDLRTAADPPRGRQQLAWCRCGSGWSTTAAKPGSNRIEFTIQAVGPASRMRSRLVIHEKATFVVQ